MKNVRQSRLGTAYISGALILLGVIAALAGLWSLSTMATGSWATGAMVFFFGLGVAGTGLTIGPGKHAAVWILTVVAYAIAVALFIGRLAHWF